MRSLVRNLFAQAPPGLLTLLCACSSLPHFDNAVSPEKVAPRVSDVVNEVQCELLAALQNSERAGSPIAALQKGQFVTNVNLTLEVTDNQGVNPALSFIHPYLTDMKSFAAILGGQLSGQQHRNVNLTFTMLFDGGSADGQKLEQCQSDAANLGLQGNLGIAETIETGLRYTTGKYDGEDIYKTDVIGIKSSTLPPDDNPLPGSPTLSPSFGATIDFTLVYGVEAGPNWTLARFTGPSSTGLLSYMRTNKDTLVLSVARAGDRPKKGAKLENLPAIEAAARAAQDNVTRMILQRLLPR